MCAQAVGRVSGERDICAKRVVCRSLGTGSQRRACGALAARRAGGAVSRRGRGAGRARGPVLPRQLPLSMGRVRGRVPECGYHGLRFANDGSCVSVPGQSQVPPGAAVRSYPLVERLGWIWIWMGDPAKAGDGRIPDWWFMDHPDWKTISGNGAAPIHTRCNYALINHNLLDLSHIGMAGVTATAAAGSPVTRSTSRRPRPGRRAIYSTATPAASRPRVRSGTKSSGATIAASTWKMSPSSKRSRLRSTGTRTGTWSISTSTRRASRCAA